MRLLIITQYFPPEMGAPQARLFELASRLRSMGHEITVLTALPNYPTGRIFDGYRRKVRVTEDMKGIRVIRTCLYPSKSSKTLPRLLSYLSFGMTSVLFGIWGIGRQDVVLIESPPLFLVPFALLVAKITRGKAVMMVSDIWPDIIIRIGYASEKSLSVKAMLWLERFSYNRSYAVALTNPGACAQIRQRFPHLKNVTVISNGVDTGMFSPQLRSQQIRSQFGAGSDDFLVGYCGLCGLAQGLEVVLGAADKLKEQGGTKFVMIGDGPTKDDLVRKAKEMNLSNMTFYDRRPKKEMPGILASLDVSLIPLAGRFPGTMPSKIYEAFASGTPPIVAKGCEGETLITQFEAGRCYEPGDNNEMAAAIRELAENTTLLQQIRNNCAELSKRFDRDAIARRTEKILVAITEGTTLPEIRW
jgi:glycosyltransferase involved in cell wall biosynthesis